MQVKFYSYISLFLFLCLLSSCDFFKKKEEIIFFKNLENKREIHSFSFVSMGTPWKVYYYSNSISFLHKRLKSILISKANKYDETFSDWSKESELKKIEKKGFTHFQCPSSLFMSGLILAKELYSLTAGVFDISLGKSNLSNLDLDEKNKCFSFEKPGPKILTFNGFVKGVSLGEMAQIFVKSGIKNFYINAGNGNMVFMLEEKHRDKFNLKPSYFSSGYNKVYFLSQSKSDQNHNDKTHQHIQDPRDRKRNLGSESKLLCFGSYKEIDQWPRISGLGDAFSTALTINPNLKPPEFCQIKF